MRNAFNYDFVFHKMRVKGEVSAREENEIRIPSIGRGQWWRSDAKWQLVLVRKQPCSYSVNDAYHDLIIIFLWFFFLPFNWCVGLFMTESGIVLLLIGCGCAFVVMLRANKIGYLNTIPPCFFAFLNSLCFHILIQKKIEGGNRHFSNIIFIV